MLPDNGSPFPWVITLAVLSLLPLLIMSLTAFLKINTVLHLLRNAIGIPNIPSASVIATLSFALALLAMAPVTESFMATFRTIDLSSATSDIDHAIDSLSQLIEPFRSFMKSIAMEEQITRFHQLIQGDKMSEFARDDLRILVPAFIVSELQRAFMIGFVLFLPFLVIDLLVSNILLAMGMQMVSPTQIALPLKLLLFASTDGWGLLSESLVLSYQLSSG